MINRSIVVVVSVGNTHEHSESRILDFRDGERLVLFRSLHVALLELKCIENSAMVSSFRLNRLGKVVGGSLDVAVHVHIRQIGSGKIVELPVDSVGEEANMPVRGSGKDNRQQKQDGLYSEHRIVWNTIPTNRLCIQ